MLTPSRGRQIALLAVCVACAVAGGVLAASGSGALGWIALVAGGFGTIVFVLNLRPGAAYLRLTAEGFEEHNPFRTNAASWSEVKGFRTYETSTQWGPTGKKVGFDYVGGKHRGAGVARSLAGVEGDLSDNYGLRAEALALLMNDWRERYAGPSPAADQV